MIVQLSLWDLLESAEQNPSEAELNHIWLKLEDLLGNKDFCAQLQIAGDAIARISEVFSRRSQLAFQDLEAVTSREGPVMNVSEFDRYVRQSMQIDLEAYIEPFASLPKAPVDRSSQDDLKTIEEDESTYTKFQEEEVSLTEAEQMDQIKSLSHGENVADWSAQIATYLQKKIKSSQCSIALLDLPKVLGLSISEVWLGLLLGDHGYEMRQTGKDFYSADQVRVFLR